MWISRTCKIYKRSIALLHSALRYPIISVKEERERGRCSGSYWGIIVRNKGRHKSQPRVFYMQLLQSSTEQRAIYFRTIMDKAVFGSAEYKQAQMIFRWLCRQARLQYDSSPSANSDAGETEKEWHTEECR